MRMTLALGLAVLVLGLIGCRDSRTGDPLDLFLVSFHEDQQVGLNRDHVLTFEFSTTVNSATVGLDTLLVTTQTDSGPVLGLYEVQGALVRFQPVVDEDNPNRGVTPLNPFGFEGNTPYRVAIPSLASSPLKVLRSTAGYPINQDFNGSFTTGADFTPRPNDPDPLVAPWDAAVYDTTNSPHSPGSPKGTPEDHDDVLTYTPVPSLSPPPNHPVSGLPDFRAQHPTNVQVQLTFTSVMDPRSFQTQQDGNLVLEYNLPGTTNWYFIPALASMSPGGKTVILAAATPLAHATRFNRYRIVFDQTRSTIFSRGGKALVEDVEKWDDVQKQIVRRGVVEADLTLWTQKEVGERGPLLTGTFPLEAFAKDPAESDTDVVFLDGQVTAGEVALRVSDDTTPCTLGPGCSTGLREPLTQDPLSPAPNQNSKGPSKIMFHGNSFQHALNAPSYKLANADALTGMSWGPLCTTVIKSTYPKMHMHVMWSNRDSKVPTTPAFLPSTTYNSNFDVQPPGFPVRDGSEPYTIETSSASTTWYPWKFQAPFTDYRVDRGLVWMAWTEVGGDVEQYFRWYAHRPAPNTRIFSPPSTAVNPLVGQPGQHTYYWTRFEFKRMRSLAVTRFYRMTPDGGGWPKWHSAVLTPTPGNLPGGTHYHVEYRGGNFLSYVQRQVGSRIYWEGQGSPIQTTPFSSNLGDMNGYEAVAVRIMFEANVDQPASLPYLNGLSFTYELP